MNIKSLSLPIPYNPAMESTDSSKIQTAQSCLRLFFFEHGLGWKSARPSNHLHFGKCAHSALEHLYKNGYSAKTVMDAFEIFNTDYRLLFPEQTDILYYPKTPATFFNLLTGYVQQYADDFSKYEVLRTEFGGTIVLDPQVLDANGLPFYTLTFKMDTVLRKRLNGHILSHEHKTKQGNYIDKYFEYSHLMGIQGGTYNHVLNCLYDPLLVDGIEINCLCFKKTKQPDFILKRFSLNFTQSFMWSWLNNVKSWLDFIWNEYQYLCEHKDSDDLLRAFPRNGRACTNWGRLCPFINYCLNVNNPLQSIDRLPADFKVEFWNPLDEELTETLTL